MKYSTKELYDKHVSGQSIEELSRQTGLSKWALYKRFQRLEKLQQQETDTQNELGIDNESNNITTLENATISSEPKKSNTNWADVALAIMSLAIMLLGIFVYRKYHHQDNPIHNDYDDYRESSEMSN